jgi:hypothetical protein
VVALAALPLDSQAAAMGASEELEATEVAAVEGVTAAAAERAAAHSRS